MSYWAMPTGALDDADTSKIWADRAWAAALAAAKPSAKLGQRSAKTVKRPGVSLARALKDLPLKPPEKPDHRGKWR